MNALDLSNAMNSIGEHTFRNGLVLARVAGFSSYGDKFTIQSAFATYDNQIIELDCPLNWIGFEFDGDPVQTAHQLISDLIRNLAGA
jgi:hypothetical protein